MAGTKKSSGKQALSQAKRHLREQERALKRRARDLKKDARRLQRLGLYKPKPRGDDAVTKYGRKVIRSLRDVLTGAAKPHKVSKKQAREMKRAGERVRGDNVIKPARGPEGETYYTRGGKLHSKKTDEQGRTVHTEEVHLPVTDMESYLRNVAADPKWKRQKGKLIGFRFFGHRSLNLYTDIDGAINRIMQYYATQVHLQTYDQEELIRNIVFTRVSSGSPEMKWFAAIETSHKKARRQRDAEYRRRYRMKMKRKAPRQYELTFLIVDRERKAKYREQHRDEYNAYQRNLMRQRRAKRKPRK